MLDTSEPSGSLTNEPQLVDVLAKAGIELERELTQLTAGLSNDNFLFVGKLSGELRSQKMVLRVNSAQGTSICLRDAELNCWTQAQEIAPKLIWVSDDKRYYVSEFIEQPLPWAALEANRSADTIMALMGCSSDALDETVGLIDDSTAVQKIGIEQASNASVSLTPERKLLSLFLSLSKLDLPANHMKISQQWRIYQQKMAHAATDRDDSSDASRGLSAKWHSSWHQLLALEALIEPWLDTVQACLVAPQFCHRDLNPHNLLLKGEKLYCIDFEYACASHPLFDLVSMLVTHDLNAQQTRFLIEEGIRHNPNLHRSALNAVEPCIKLFWLFACAWALLMAAEATTAAQHQTYLEWFDQYFPLLSVL